MAQLNYDKIIQDIDDKILLNPDIELTSEENEALGLIQELLEDEYRTHWIDDELTENKLPNMDNVLWTKLNKEEYYINQ